MKKNFAIKSIGFLFLWIVIISCEKENNLLFQDAGNPIPVNTYLAASHWPISHANSYAQASTDLAGPTKASEEYKLGFKDGAPGMITMAVSGPYPDGSRTIWGADITHIIKYKDTGNGLTIIDKIEKENLVVSELLTGAAISGAYTLLDADNQFYLPQRQTINVYGDAIVDDANSAIQLLRSYELPSDLLIDPEELIVGFNMLYDGNIVYVTQNGLVGVSDRFFISVVHFQLPNEDVISNSIAVDEEGGIYIVTSKKMYRVQWTGTELTLEESKGGWAADYETGAESSGIRLGDGSGSTPTLMGTGDEDKFVVITDGQDLMHIVLFWRAAIPTDWEQIEGTKSRRIAAQVPITFGDEDASLSLSEQSVCVSGYGALVVNNLLASPTGSFIGDLLAGGNPVNAPYGAEKFIWNPASRKFSSVWVNQNVSFPSGIPCMSTGSNMMYCMGQQDGTWNFTGLDWTTGALKFRKPLGALARFNSAYAATEISLNNGLYSGTILGNVGIWQE
jgi:hypothetical protein